MPKSTIAPYGEAEHRIAMARGTRTKMSPTAVLRAHYDPASENLVLALNNGACVALPIREIRELRSHSADDVATVEVSPGRDGLLWPSIDVAISAPGLLTDFFGSAVHAQLGSVGGSRSTPAKTLSARTNGAKGGRPRAKAIAS
jgi:Protein of unknown function (DUF2442)